MSGPIFIIDRKPKMEMTYERSTAQLSELIIDALDIHFTDPALKAANPADFQIHFSFINQTTIGFCPKVRGHIRREWSGYISYSHDPDCREWSIVVGPPVHPNGIIRGQHGISRVFDEAVAYMVNAQFLLHVSKNMR